MNILHEKPPNYDKIVAALPAVADMPHAVFTYGGTIYYPFGGLLPDYKIAHEQVHMEQQLEVGVDWWWDTFLQDKIFRFNEELPAYQADYKTFCKQYKDKNERLRYLRSLADDISGPAYNNMVLHSDAMRMIKV